MKEEAIEWFKSRIKVMPNSETKEMFNIALTALEQQEKAEDEWCPDCKEYDKDRHCCPMFNRVIRGVLAEMKENDG